MRVRASGGYEPIKAKFEDSTTTSSTFKPHHIEKRIVRGGPTTGGLAYLGKESLPFEGNSTYGGDFKKINPGGLGGDSRSGNMRFVGVGWGELGGRRVGIQGGTVQPSWGHLLNLGCHSYAC
jgi:hypothetical protein